MSALAFATPTPKPLVKRFRKKTTTFDSSFIAGVAARLEKIASQRRISFNAFLEAAGSELLELDDDRLLAILEKHAARRRRKA